MSNAEYVIGELQGSGVGGGTAGHDSLAPGIHLKTYTAGEDKSAWPKWPRNLVWPDNANHRNKIPLSMTSRDDDFLFAGRMNSWTSMQLEEEEDDEERWEEEKEDDSHGGSVGGDMFSAVLGIIKAMVGPAILYLPNGFASAGYAVALPILATSTCMYLYSSKCLLESWKLESDKALVAGEGVSLLESGRQEGNRKRRSSVVLSYPELAYRSLGTQGEALVKVGIALMQSGVCLTYMIFVPQNIASCVLILFGWDVPPSYFMVVMLVFQIPFCWIRDIRKLTLTNFFANLLILYGLITCLGFAISNAARSDHGDSGRGPLAEIRYKFANLEAFKSGWLLFIGTSVLLFEGSITLCVPLQEAVDGTEEREAFPQVYRKVIMGIICFYTVFGITCWMSFGDDVHTVMTTSLPRGVLATTVQLAYSIAVIFTFPLQNFPSLEIACQSIAGGIQKSCAGTESSVFQKRNVISSFLVCVLAVIALSTMNRLDKVVSLMGSLLGCPIAFVFPPLIHTKLDPNLSKTRRFGNLLVAGMGICAMLLASITTLLTW